MSKGHEVKEWVSTSRAADLLGVSAATVRNRAVEGQYLYRRGSQPTRQRFQIATDAAGHVLDADGRPSADVQKESTIAIRLARLEKAVIHVQEPNSGTKLLGSQMHEHEVRNMQRELERLRKVIRLLAEALVLLSDADDNDELAEVLGAAAEAFLRNVGEGTP